MTGKPIGLEEQLRGVKREQIEIEVADGAMQAYLAAPPGQDKGPGVVVVTHVFGIDQDMKDVCDELAARGCVAIAQNFFWRDPDPGVLVEADVPRAIARAMRIDFPKSMNELRCGIDEVRRHPNCNGKVILLGYCFGGPYAWRAACDGLGLDASVSFHGTYVSKYLKPGDKPSCPVEFHYGEHDHLAPAEELAAVKAAADANGCAFIVHPDAGHAYMMPANSHYHEGAARVSWDAALRLIKTLQA